MWLVGWPLDGQCWARCKGWSVLSQVQRCMRVQQAHGLSQVRFTFQSTGGSVRGKDQESSQDTEWTGKQTKHRKLYCDLCWRGSHWQGEMGCTALWAVPLRTSLLHFVCGKEMDPALWTVCIRVCVCSLLRSAYFLCWPSYFSCMLLWGLLWSKN